MTAPTARLIALEGIDGCGKTTQARALAGATGALLTHEPGGTPLGRELRRVLLGLGPGVDAAPVPGPAAPVARAEALLMAADRAQHVTEVVRPALASGRWVVTDRFSGSTLAYQGSGQGLPRSVLVPLVEWAAGGVTPDLNVLVDVPLDVARARLAAAPDRLERMDDAFFARVRAGYLELADGDPEHWVVVDGSAPQEAVAAAVTSAVRARLGPPPSWPSPAELAARP